MSELLTTGQAARILGISRATVRDAIKCGDLRCGHRTRGGHARITVAEVERYRAAYRGPRISPRERVELERQLVHTRYLRATTTAVAKLASRLDLDHALRTVVETLVADFDAALARVWLYDGATNALYLRVTAGVAQPPAYTAGGRIDLTASAHPFARVVRTHQPTITNDFTTTSHLDPAWLARERISGMATLPFLIGDDLRGVLVHFSRRPITEEMIDALTGFATIVAASIRNIELFTREQAARAEAETSAAEASAQARRLALVQQTARDLTVINSVRELCERLVQAIHARMSRHVAAVYLVECDELRLAAYRVPTTIAPLEAVRLPLGVGIVGHVAATRQPYLCHDTQCDPYFHRASDLGTRSAAAVPVLAGADLVGVLDVESPHPGTFDDDDLATLAAIADQAAIAIQNARLYEAEADLRRRAEERARRIEHVQRVGEELKLNLDDHEVGLRVVEAACTALGFRSAALNLVDRPGTPDARARVVATAGLPPEGAEALIAHDYPLSDIEALFCSEYLFSRSYFIPDGEVRITTATDIPVWTPAIANEGPNAWRQGDQMLVPLTDRQGGHLLGFLSVDDPESGRRPEREEVEVLEIFADQAVVALRNARMLAEARRQAERDPVTGLFNHRAAHARLEAALAGARDGGRPLGLLALDVNDFKLINDTHGHPTGDMALRHVAALLERCARATDVAARLGGDEFLLILPGASRAQSVEVAQRLSALAHDATLRVEGVGLLPLRLSVGVASYPHDADHPNALLTIADARLYEAKRAGGRTVEAGRDPPDTESGEHDTAELAGFDMLSALVTAVDNKDRYTSEHSEEVAALACLLADALGLSAATQRTLRVAGLLHDVGKIGVPDRVLRKPGKLEPDEWEAMRQHVALSVALVRAVAPDPDVLAAVAHHHERWDGEGYPHRLAGTQVPLLGRIMIVADAVSAMVPRPPLSTRSHTRYDRRGVASRRRHPVRPRPGRAVHRRVRPGAR